jgi:hypothetical protein
MILKDLRGVVGAITERAQLLLAVRALAASDLERRNDTLTELEVGDIGAKAVDDAHELVAKDVALLEAHDLAMVEVKIGAADGATGDLEDNIVRLGDVRDSSLDHANILVAEPGQSLHLRTILTVLRVMSDTASVVKESTDKPCTRGGRRCQSVPSSPGRHSQRLAWWIIRES